MLIPLVKQLEAQCRVTRHPGTDDERKAFITLNRAGWALQKEAPEIARCLLDRTGVDPTELAGTSKRIIQIRDNLEEKAPADRPRQPRGL